MFPDNALQYAAASSSVCFPIVCTCSMFLGLYIPCWFIVLLLHVLKSEPSFVIVVVIPGLPACLRLCIFPLWLCVLAHAMDSDDGSWSQPDKPHDEFINIHHLSAAFFVVHLVCGYKVCTKWLNAPNGSSRTKPNNKTLFFPMHLLAKLWSCLSGQVWNNPGCRVNWSVIFFKKKQNKQQQLWHGRS